MLRHECSADLTWRGGVFLCFPVPLSLAYLRDARTKTFSFLRLVLREYTDPTKLVALELDC